MGTTRNLQEITIIGEEDGSVNGAPTRSPVVAIPRPTTIRVCAQAESDAVVATTEVTYRYQVELNPDSGEAITDATWSVSPISNMVPNRIEKSHSTKTPRSRAMLLFIIII